MILINLKSGEKTEVLKYIDELTFRYTIPHFGEPEDESRGYKEGIRRGVNFLLTGDRNLPYPETPKEYY